MTALAGDPLDGGSAGVPESQDPGHLVERLAGGVVTGAAQEQVVAVVPHQDEVGVAAGGDEAEAGKLGARVLRAFLDQPVSVDVALQVIDSKQGQFVGQGEGLGHTNADEQ